MEEWLNIDGYPDYQVSNTGKVKSIKYGKERILKPLNTNGYQRVILYLDGKVKRIYIHQLVSRAFLPNPENLTQVNHKDENPLNNNVENLEWCTQEHNINYGTRTQRAAKSKSKPVRCIETNIIYPSIIEIQRKLGFSQGNICDCCNCKRYKTVGGFHWEWA